MKQFFRYFIQGLLITVPAGITILVFVKIFSWIVALFNTISTAIDPSNKFGFIVNQYVDTLLAVLVVIGLIILIGFLGSTYLFTPLFSRIERAIERAPLVKIIYSSIKDFLSAFVGSKKRFNKPVLVVIDKVNDIRQMGFITQTDLAHIGFLEDKVAVYMPMSYAFSGKLIIVPKEYVTPIDIPAGEVMKFIVSGGVTDIDGK